MTAQASRASDRDDRSRAEQVEEFGRSAPPGETMPYFSGGWLVQSDPAVKAARRLIDAGIAIPTQKRLAPGLFDYCLTKRRAIERPPVSRDAVHPDQRRERGSLPRVDDESEQLMAVLRLLAGRGEVCPTNAQLAELACLKDAESARYRLTLLEIAGRIAIVTPPQGPRVVTIASTGRSTAQPRGSR